MQCTNFLLSSGYWLRHQASDTIPVPIKDTLACLLDTADQAVHPSLFSYMRAQQLGDRVDARMQAGQKVNHALRHGGGYGCDTLVLKSATSSTDEHISPYRILWSWSRQREWQTCRHRENRSRAISLGILWLLRISNDVVLPKRGGGYLRIGSRSSSFNKFASCKTAAAAPESRRNRLGAHHPAAFSGCRSHLYSQRQVYNATLTA